MTDIKIVSTQPATYLDKAGNAVKGFSLQILLPERDEQHEILVPSLKESVVKEAVTKLVKEREALDKFTSVDVPKA